ncbi:hypothetical protein [Notoacmeibacter sp. MSK16QG-6]|uniref:hypothetical protein n=1 Tax=Notoacmeibacter sp. MSK16QG-6 TaxID=2957982 RepID=UPI0020A07E94|nr:hypothetical protein [Notoacmeibacter sp. MSK16QG-6]MCP1200081.1 hypothetical protein [Notoacmeibacter sp. MSK16QG-6]
MNAARRPRHKLLQLVVPYAVYEAVLARMSEGETDEACAERLMGEFLLTEGEENAPRISGADERKDSLGSGRSGHGAAGSPVSPGGAVKPSGPANSAEPLSPPPARAAPSPGARLAGPDTVSADAHGNGNATKGPAQALSSALVHVPMPVEPRQKAMAAIADEEARAEAKTWLAKKKAAGETVFFSLPDFAGDVFGDVAVCRRVSRLKRVHWSLTREALLLRREAGGRLSDVEAHQLAALVYRKPVPTPTTPEHFAFFEKEGAGA